MTTRNFTRTQLVDEYELPVGNDLVRVISDEITDVDRWSLTYRLVFQLLDQPEDQAWSVSYSVGATENQDESPWEYGNNVTATLVHRVERMVQVWETA